MGNESNSHRLNELEQEKEILAELNKYLEKKDATHTEILNALNQDIRTPLVTIKGYTDMLIDGKFGEINEIQREKLMHVKHSIETLISAVFEDFKRKDSQVHEGL